MPTVAIVDVDSHVEGLAKAQARIAWTEHALDNMRPPLKGIVGDIHRQTMAAFASEGTVIGDPWTPLDPSTVRQKTAEGYPFPSWPLVASGKMMASATSNAGPYSVGAVEEHQAWLTLDWERDGWNIPALHQMGVPWRLVTQRRHDKRGQAYTVTYWWHLPARPFWKATGALALAGMARIADWIWGPPGL